MTYIKKLARYSISCLIACNTYANLEEVTVTAQKREQQIHDIPFAISALNSKQLESLNITNLNTLADFTPGLTISALGPNQIAYTIRGLTASEPGAQAAPRLAVYLNNIDISRNRSSMTELYDLERIEIIKGPQSTLFGTTAAAGAIAIYTRAPQKQRESQISLGIGSDNLSEFRLSSTGGNDYVQARIAVLNKDRDGYIHNQSNPSEKLGSLDRFALRPSLRLTPYENLQVDFIINHEIAKDTVVANKSGTIAPIAGNTSPFTAASISGNQTTHPLFNHTGLNLDRQTTDYNLSLTADLGNISLTSITGFREFDSVTPFDADGSRAHAFELLEDSSGEQVSQELRFAKQGDNYQLNAGLSYLKEQNQRSNSFSTEEGTYLLCIPVARATFSQVLSIQAQLDPRLIPFAALINPNTGLPCVNSNGTINSVTPLVTGGLAQQIPYYAEFTDYGDNISQSVYIDGSYQLSEHLELSLGARYIKENRDSAFKAAIPGAQLLQNQLSLLTLGDTAGATIRGGNTDDDILLRANLRYQINNQHSVYIAYSEGRRSQVTRITSALDNNFQATVSIDQIPAEVLQNYELGIKGNSQKLSYSAATFYQDYSDYQVTFLTPAGQFIVDNAGSTSNIGAELAINWQLNNHLKLFANASYIDNTLDNNLKNGLFAGKQLVFTPKKTAVIGTYYETLMSNNYKVFANINASYQSDKAFDAQRQPNEPITGLPLTQDAYTVVKASTGLVFPSKHQLKLWVDNLTNEQYLLNASSISSNVGTPTYTAATGRMWGVTLNLYY